MKYIHYVAFVLLAALAVACEDESDAHLVTSTTQLTFPPEGGTQTIRAESNSSWHIVSNEAWLSAYPTSGNETQDVAITVAITDNNYEQESKVIVMTDDGSKVVNVSVKVQGTVVKTGKHLIVRVDDKTFSGRAKAVDSLDIRSNVNWEILGPEWLEAWDGDRWRPLSKDRGLVMGNGTKKVFVRTSNDNKNKNSLEDVLIVREYLTGDYSSTVNVRQVGRMEVVATFPWVLEDGLTFDWHTGCDVAKIYFKVTENKQGMPSDDEVRNTYEITDESYYNSATGLKPGSTYYVNAVTEDAYGNMDTHMFFFYGNLPVEATPVAEISAGVYDGNGNWRFHFSTNTITTAASFFYATDKSNSAFMYNDPILWLIAMENSNKNYWFREGTGYTTPGWISWESPLGFTGEIHAIVCALSEIGGQFRPRVFRFDRYYDADGKRLPDKPLLDRIPKAMLNDPSLR